MTASALSKLDPEPLIAQIANGAYLTDLADHLGVDKRRLSEHLRRHPDYALAKECSIETQLDAVEKALRDPSTDIARAREQWRFVVWRAEREAPHRWGQRTQVDVNVDIGHALQELAARLSSQAALDGDAERCDDATDCCETGIT